MDVISKLQPDLIILIRKKTTGMIFFQLAEEFPVFISDVSTVEDALK